MLDKVFYDTADTLPIPDDLIDEESADEGEFQASTDWISASGVPLEPYWRFYVATQESTDVAQKFVPHPSDIFISTHSKSGTTLLQFMLEVC